MNSSDIKFTMDIDEVMEITTLSRAQIYAMEKVSLFPGRIPTTLHRSNWDSQDVFQWMLEKINSRDPSSHPKLAEISIHDKFLSARGLATTLAPTEHPKTQARYRPNFPSPFYISKTRKAWLHSEILAWVLTFKRR